MSRFSQFLFTFAAAAAMTTNLGACEDPSPIDGNGHEVAPDATPTPPIDGAVAIDAGVPPVDAPPAVWHCSGIRMGLLQPQVDQMVGAHQVIKAYDMVDVLRTWAPVVMIEAGIDACSTTAPRGDGTNHVPDRCWGRTHNGVLTDVPEWEMGGCEALPIPTTSDQAGCPLNGECKRDANGRLRGGFCYSWPARPCRAGETTASN